MGRTQRTRLRRKVSLVDTKMETTISTTTNSLSSLYKYLHNFGWRNDTQLSVRNFRETGRGICSKREFLAGDILIEIPINALITINTLESDNNFKKLFDISRFNKDTCISFQSLVALYVLYQKHLKSNSLIEPYLNSIPTNFTTPYFCPTQELYCLPEGILEKTVEQNHIIRTSYKILQTVLNVDNCCQCCGQQYFRDIFNLDAYKWSYFIINTRSVYINSAQLSCKQNFFKPLLDGGTNLALSPFLDLFNHSDNVSTTAALVPTGGTDKQLKFTLTLNHIATSVIRPYEQLFISYGALTNLKLLTEYGFFIPGNKHDFFDISLLDIENFIKNDKTFSTRVFHRNKFIFIRDHNLDDNMFVHLNDGISHNLNVVLNIIFKETTNYPNVLNQVAFGSAEKLDNIDVELKMLVDFKINEYRVFISGLKKIENLSESGNVVLKYMKECIKYLQEYLIKYQD